MSEIIAPIPAQQDGPVTLTIDEMVEKIIEQEKDHAAFLRQVVRDNILVSRTAKLLVTEIDRFRADVVSANRLSSGSARLALSNALNRSASRLHNASTPPPNMVQS